MIGLPLLATMMVITFFGIMIGTLALLALYFRIRQSRRVTTVREPSKALQVQARPRALLSERTEGK